ncbi:hypothetical protein H5410_005691 [Solanum commersonii]|uniref:Uncharacterized protein n=1 Tax=Solanum commersonii TaxID=4109 RepID=A0A9J6A7H7_SOLCO|nr:hypothetical protein H5410_005691 [Solanum commersonii]
MQDPIDILSNYIWDPGCWKIVLAWCAHVEHTTTSKITRLQDIYLGAVRPCYGLCRAPMLWAT